MLLKYCVKIIFLETSFCG